MAGASREYAEYHLAVRFWGMVFVFGTSKIPVGKY